MTAAQSPGRSTGRACGPCRPRRCSVARRSSERSATLRTSCWRPRADDAWLVERAGGMVRVVESNAANMKVTTPTDLRVAEVLLAR